MRKLLGGLFLGLTVADMGAKQYVEDDFKKNEERKTIIPKVVLRKVYNKGFAFNTLDKYPKVIKGSSAVLAVIVAAYDAWLWFQNGRFLEKIGMALVSAGAVSNIYDRLVRGKVIDYIGFNCKWKRLRKLTFNLAAFYVFAGALIYTIAQIFKK